MTYRESMLWLNRTGIGSSEHRKVESVFRSLWAQYEHLAKGDLQAMHALAADLWSAACSETRIAGEA